MIGVSAQPKPEYPEPVRNFGAIAEEDGPATCEFPVVNTGTEPLTILSARATCGCTTPVYSHKPIAPGDTSYVSVTFDPTGRPGRFNKMVYLQTNGTPSKASLEIKGVVVGSEETIKRRYPVNFGPLKLSQSVFYLGESMMGRMKTIYLEGYNRSSDSLRVKVENAPKYIDIAVAPPVAGPGEQVTIIAYINPQNGANYGIVEDTLKVIPVPGLEFELPTMLTVNEDFTNVDPEKLAKSPIASPSTDRIDLGKVKHDAQPIFVKFTLANNGKSDLKIRRLYCVDKGIAAKAISDTVKKEKSTDIILAVDPRQLTGDIINSRLQIITNDPQHPVQTVRIVGQWEK